MIDSCHPKTIKLAFMSACPLSTKYYNVRCKSKDRLFGVEIMCPSKLLFRELQRKCPDRRVGIIQGNINMMKDNVTKWNDMSVSGECSICELWLYISSSVC